jgi:hypothetical protein
MLAQHICCMLRCVCGAPSDHAGIGRRRGAVSIVGDEHRQDFRAGEGHVRRDRLLPED